MAETKIVGVWLYVTPRKVTDPANLIGAATIIVTEADKRKLGDSLMKVTIRVYDEDSISDDKLYEDSNFQLGPALLQIGPNTFGLQAIVSRSTLENSEPPWEGSAELYFKVMASGGGVSTKWARSQTESVAFE